MKFEGVDKEEGRGGQAVIPKVKKDAFFIMGLFPHL